MADPRLKGWVLLSASKAYVNTYWYALDKNVSRLTKTILKAFFLRFSSPSPYLCLHVLRTFKMETHEKSSTTRIPKILICMTGKVNMTEMLQNSTNEPLAIRHAIRYLQGLNFKKITGWTLYSDTP